MRDRLERVETYLMKIRKTTVRYHQSDRIHERSREVTRLREAVWSLLHRERKLYRVVDGHLCLRASRRADLAEAYRSLNEDTEATRQRGLARACREGWLSDPKSSLP